MARQGCSTSTLPSPPTLAAPSSPEHPHAPERHADGANRVGVFTVGADQTGEVGLPRTVALADVATSSCTLTSRLCGQGLRHCLRLQLSASRFQASLPDAPRISVLPWPVLTFPGPIASSLDPCDLTEAGPNAVVGRHLDAAWARKRGRGGPSAGPRLRCRVAQVRLLQSGKDMQCGLDVVLGCCLEQPPAQNKHGLLQPVSALVAHGRQAQDARATILRIFLAQYKAPTSWSITRTSDDGPISSASTTTPGRTPSCKITGFRANASFSGNDLTRTVQDRRSLRALLKPAREKPHAGA
jgi:hypothetical protein